MVPAKNESVPHPLLEASLKGGDFASKPLRGKAGDTFIRCGAR